MQYLTAAILGFAAVAVANPAPQVTADISPQAPRPDMCMASYDGSFRITTVNATTATKKAKRQMSNLAITLENGILRDQDGNIGYIAANTQFQFAKNQQPQAGAIYTAGFGICPNQTISLGGTTVFQSCLSGDFSNLYYGNDAAQCSDVFIQALPVSGNGAISSGSMSASSMESSMMASMTSAVGVTQTSDNQPQAMTSAASGISQIGDNQPQAMTTAAVSQIGDNQPQAPTMAGNATMTFAPTQYTGGAVAATAAPMAIAAAGAFLALL